MIPSGSQHGGCGKKLLHTNHLGYSGEAGVMGMSPLYTGLAKMTVVLMFYPIMCDSTGSAVCLSTDMKHGRKRHVVSCDERPLDVPQPGIYASGRISVTGR